MQRRSFWRGSDASFVVTIDFTSRSPAVFTITSTLGPEGQVITFPTPAQRSFASGPLLLSALNVTASSQLPVSFSASGACAVSGTSLTFTTVGACAVTASQPGDATFLPAYPVANYFEVAPSRAVLSVTGGTFANSGRPQPVSVSVSPVVSGVLVQYCREGDATPDACSSHPPRDAGVYHVSVVLSNHDYVATPVSTVMTINEPAPLFPPDLLGSVTTSAGPTTVGFSRAGVVIQSRVVHHPFPTDVPIRVDGISEESLGTFVVPSTTDVATWLNLFRGSTSSSLIVNAASTTAHSAAQLSQQGSIAFPDNNFPGAGTYEIVEVQTSGFVPGSTVSAVRHSTSALVLSQAVANSHGVATIDIPIYMGWAGQTHQMFLAGSYQALSSKTSSDHSGNVATTLTISKAMLTRLSTQAPMVMVFDDPADPALDQYNALALPAADAYQAYVKRTTPLNLPHYKPVHHPASTMNRLTGAAAVLSAAAAGLAVARAASGMSGAASAASHASSVGTRGASAAHRAATENVEALHHTHDSDREHIGDHSRTWRAPGRGPVDSLSLAAPLALSRFSPLAAMTVADGAYWRAMFGSLSVVFPIAGAVLGVLASIQTHGYPLPPHLALFIAIISLGFLDALAGLAAATASLVGAIVTGHAFSVNMLISGLLLATLWFGLPVMVKKIRPFIRPHPNDFDSWWVRYADFIVGPVFAGFLASKLVDTFSLVTNLRISLVTHATLIGIVVASVAFVRYCVTTTAIFAYPRRLREVTPTHLNEQEESSLAVSVVVRMVFAGLIFAALLGRYWLVLPLVALFGLGILARNYSWDRSVTTWFYRFVPRNLGKVLLFEVVGTLATAAIIRHLTSGYWQIATLLFVILTLTMVTDFLAGLRGKDWPINFATRLAGVALFILTVLQLSDHLIT